MKLILIAGIINLSKNYYCTRMILQLQITKYIFMSETCCQFCLCFIFYCRSPIYVTRIDFIVLQKTSILAIVICHLLLTLDSFFSVITNIFFNTRQIFTAILCSNIFMSWIYREIMILQIIIHIKRNEEDFFFQKTARQFFLNNVESFRHMEIKFNQDFNSDLMQATNYQDILENNVYPCNLQREFLA